MGTFTLRVMRLLSDQLTGTSIREIDELFDNRGIALGPPQPRENDKSVRRERMRRYLIALDLSDAADAQRLTAVLGDLLQRIVQDAPGCGTNGFGSCARTASRSTRRPALCAWEGPERI